MANNTAGKNFLNNLASSPLLPIAVIGGVAFFVLKGQLGNLFNWLNPFADSKEDKQNAKADKVGSPWTPTYYKVVFSKLPQGKGYGIKTQMSKAEENAQTIYDALGRLSWNHLSDDDTSVIAVFKNMEAKTSVSYLTDIFQTMFKKDLFDWIKYYLNDDNMTKIIAIVDALPVGIVNADHKLIK